MKTQAHYGNQVCPRREVEVMVLILQVTGMITCASLGLLFWWGFGVEEEYVHPASEL